MTLSPKDAAISSSVRCFVSLVTGGCQISLSSNKQAANSRASSLEWRKISYLRKVKISHSEEEDSACYKNVIVVFADVGKCTGAGFGDCELIISQY